MDGRVGFETASPCGMVSTSRRPSSAHFTMSISLVWVQPAAQDAARFPEFCASSACMGISHISHYVCAFMPSNSERVGRG